MEYSKEQLEKQLDEQFARITRERKLTKLERPPRKQMLSRQTIRTMGIMEPTAAMCALSGLELNEGAVAHLSSLVEAYNETCIDAVNEFLLEHEGLVVCEDIVLKFESILKGGK